MEVKLKINDWCFCEFKLQQIIEVEEDRITSVSDGKFRLSGYDLSDRCFPLNLKIKNCSDGVAYWSKRFLELKHNSLNHPDLNRELIRRWIEMCENINDNKILHQLYDELDKFGNTIVSEVNNLKYREVEGIKLFTR